jgi:ubiquitin-like-conjugating enzyme ATG10
MDQPQFESAIQQLARLFDTVCHAVPLQHSEWQRVTLIPSHNLSDASAHFLRVTRRRKNSHADVSGGEAEDAPGEDGQDGDGDEDGQDGEGNGDEQGNGEKEEEEDSECLSKFPLLPLPPPPTTLTLTYDIIYSPTYRVPVLYIHKTPRAEPFLARVQRHAGLSLVDHPVTGTPVYFLHPCRTQDAVGDILDRSSSRGTTGERAGLEWLMVWLGVMGAAVGLSVPLELAVGMEVTG